MVLRNNGFDWNKTLHYTLIYQIISFVQNTKQIVCLEASCTEGSQGEGTGEGQGEGQEDRQEGGTA